LAHYTIIFQAFVCMQIFNEINARKLGVKEFNVFSGFFNNPLFLLILVGTMVVQYFLVQYGGPPVRTVPLSQEQHLICIAIGAGSLIWGVIVKLFLPATIFGKIDLEDQKVSEGMVRFSKSMRGRSQKPNGQLN
jgi:magnesium-transporting ATPase (P-type)